MAGESKKAIVAALIGNSLIAVTKFIAAALTRSAAMFAEGVHSVVDSGNQVLLLFGHRRATKPPDTKHPFGYGKEVYFWSFVVAILLFAVGAGISVYEGVHSLMHPAPIDDAWVNYIVLGAAIIFEAFSLTIAWRTFSRVRGRMGVLKAVRVAKDPSLVVVLFEDTAAMLGLIVALVGVFLSARFGWLWADGAASVTIGAILAVTAGWLAYETKGLLIGESTHPMTEDSIRAIVGGSDAVARVNEVLTLHMGPEYVLALVSADFHANVSSRDIEAAIASATARIQSEHPLVKRVFVEAAAGEA